VSVLLIGLAASASASTGDDFSAPDRVFRGTPVAWTNDVDITPRGTRAEDPPISILSNGKRSTARISLTQAAEAAPTWALVAPYVWAPMMDGTVGANGNTTDVNLSFSDLLDLVPDLNGAVMGHLEVGKGPRGLLLDALIMELSPSRRGPGGGRINLESNLTVFEALGTLRLLGAAPGEAAPSDITVDVLGGLRYYDVMGGLTISPVIGPTISAEQTENWVDLVIGGRTGVALTESLAGFMRGDIAGFGIGTSSRFAWNLTAGFEYHCVSHPGWSTVLGYRILDIDQVKYSGAERFFFDVRLHGPFLAFAYRF
jgi:hypothetical protein